MLYQLSDHLETLSLAPPRTNLQLPPQAHRIAPQFPPQNLHMLSIRSANRFLRVIWVLLVLKTFERGPRRRWLSLELACRHGALSSTSLE